MDFNELQEHLRDTQAALGQVRGALSEDPDSVSNSIIAASLRKRQLRLEQEFSEALDDIGIDICRYRMFGNWRNISVSSFATSLNNFQLLFTSVYDAIKTDIPKMRARISPEIRTESALNVGYTFPGSLGVVLTLPNQRLLFGESDMDSAMQQIFDMAKSADSQTILEFSRNLGPACVRAMYKWADGNVQSDLNIQIDWQRRNKVRLSLTSETSEFEHLSRIISETSDEVVTDVELIGILVGADVRSGTFHFDLGTDGEIRGELNDTISESQVVELPRRYRAIITKKESIRYSTEEENISYRLERLESM